MPLFMVDKAGTQQEIGVFDAKDEKEARELVKEVYSGPIDIRLMQEIKGVTVDDLKNQWSKIR